MTSSGRRRVLTFVRAIRIGNASECPAGNWRPLFVPTTDMCILSLRARLGWLMSVELLSSGLKLRASVLVGACFSNLVDIQETKHAAHSIKGAAANLMCHRVRVASMYLEKAGQAGMTLEEGEWDDSFDLLDGPCIQLHRRWSTTLHAHVYAVTIVNYTCL